MDAPLDHAQVHSRPRKRQLRQTLDVVYLEATERQE
jgi:hypothetical protein